ncbi:BBE domain-containing protein [Kribbella sp. NBC_00889]|uniref:BBE domain-containing protein n=1 Tax=Kribbella sp. NBC_00889 TaxID=2975974 RepID=UPI00386EACB2|nr:BBE domain-containing protein [Kribbella sp. NBC_00889]
MVTSFRMATIPAAKIGFFRLTWPESTAAAAVRGWQRFAQTAPVTSWGNLHIDARSNGALSIHVLGISTTGNASAAAAQLESFVGSKATVRSITALLGAVKAAARAKTPASAIIDPLGGQAAKQPAGGYVNYVETGRAVSTYYGASLARLRTVKKKCDPANFFHTAYTLG